MGLFDRYDDSAKINTRNDDRDGLYWQRIDEIKVETSQAGEQYLQIYKTTVHVVDDRDGRAQPVGSETTQALFRDKFKYFEKETKSIVKALLGLEIDEANELTKDKVKELLTGGMFHGMVAELSASTQAKKKKPDETFTRVIFKRAVPVAELKATLDETSIKAFWPNGL